MQVFDVMPLQVFDAAPLQVFGAVLSQVFNVMQLQVFNVIPLQVFDVKKKLFSRKNQNAISANTQPNPANRMRHRKSIRPGSLQPAQITVDLSHSRILRSNGKG
jgi:hypothetical protein